MQLLKKALAGFVSFLLFILLVVVLWQVFSRYVLNDPSTITEELARVLLMWLGLFGSSYALMENAHLSLDLFSPQMQPSLKRELNYFVEVMMLVFALILLVGGLGICRNAFSLDQQVASLHISMGFVYLAVPINGFLMLLSSLDKLRLNTWKP
jgi:TRAP-type C4-dicarboxylate transport system permease small subunit